MPVRYHRRLGLQINLRTTTQARGLFFSSTARAASRHDEPIHIGIVGSGPAGFYTAARVMSRLPGAKIDMYEALPVPFGLVRYGVAPDHPEVKNCQDLFDEVAASPDFRFVGNVSVGESSQFTGSCRIPLQSLMRHYDAIVMAYGASKDKLLGIPNESKLKGIYSARQFVGWYNGLPEHAGLEPDLTLGDEAVVIGQGNVALDAARMLLEDIDTLRKTDISEQALACLMKSRIRTVRVVGRRGPMQTAFTIKEVRELMNLRRVAFNLPERCLIPEDIKTLPRVSRRLMEVLLRGSSTPYELSKKAWILHSCLSPSFFLPRRNSPAVVAATKFQITRLEDPFDPKSGVTPSDEAVILPSSVVFRSVGYKAAALSGFAEVGIQFDERQGIISNDGFGRVLYRAPNDRKATEADVRQVHGMYCAGWVKRGPTGVIASTMQDAFATGDAIVQDWKSGTEFLPSALGEYEKGWDPVSRELGHSPTLCVSWDQWHKIDKAERARGKERGKQREKFTKITDMLSVVT